MEERKMINEETKRRLREMKMDEFVEILDIQQQDINRYVLTE